MPYSPTCHLFVAHKTGINRQPRSVRRGKAGFTQCMRSEREDRTAVRFPISRLPREGPKHLIQDAVAVVNYQHVTVAGAVWPALDGRVGRHGIGAGVAFLTVGIKEDRDRRLALQYPHEWDPNRPTLPQPRPKICMYLRIEADRVDIV